MEKIFSVIICSVSPLILASFLQNSPNDLQMISDAPAHHLFCLLPPVTATQNSLPEVLAVVQVLKKGNKVHQQLGSLILGQLALICRTKRHHNERESTHGCIPFCALHYIFSKRAIVCLHQCLSTYNGVIIVVLTAKYSTRYVLGY